ncbi:DUF1622 domain-containing protein [Microbacterium sp. ASV49]|uniref:DUF1622 domain-containing protein n=1 Tax=Microbacterium candidum TaxID=3041922 RepID=A0ABT7MWR3_9MICO|nr:DUF1622 domain-containing protein [Microbacterium sp. ASV49]MDL9978896.1 DUF1622 domain-containing protein [Microbacterium sp. ASV49]
MNIDEIFGAAVVAFEVVGAAVMIVGFLFAVVLGVRSLIRREGGAKTFQVVRSTLGGAILLGLEVLVAADLIRTLREPTLQDAATLGIIVLIRTFLSMSIQIEIDGTLPWRRALLTSGAQVAASAIRDAGTKDAGARRQS